jgi:tetratricopeptide (TPR) repeat protein
MKNTPAFCFVIIACGLLAPSVHARPFEGAAVPTRSATPAPRTDDLRQQMATAERALREARLSDAEIAYRQLAEAHPRLPNVWLHLGNVYARQLQLEAAVRAYEEGLQHNPHDGRLWNNLALVQLKQAIQTLEASSRVLQPNDLYSERIRQLHEALLTAGTGPVAVADSAAPLE